MGLSEQKITEHEVTKRKISIELCKNEKVRERELTGIDDMLENIKKGSGDFDHDSTTFQIFFVTSENSYKFLNGILFSQH